MVRQVRSDWVLLRGLARESAHWNGFDETLADRVGARVSCLDLPGTGDQYARPSPTSVRDIARELRTRAPGSPPRVLVGLSLGAMVCLEWASRWPWEVSGLVLVNSSAANLCRPHRRLRLEAALTIVRLMATADPTTREAGVLALTTRARASEGDLVARFAHVQRLRPVSRENALRQLVAATRYRVGFVPAGVRSLVLCSQLDRLVDPRCSRRLARRLDAEVAEHPHAGHDLPLDDPEWCLDQIEAFARSARA
jgi:pimeloyl-ACP methyl ester carboxylesterase